MLEHSTRTLKQLRALGDFIKAQRQMAELSLRELAARTNVSNPYLSQIERGLHEPSVRVLKAIAGALNMSAESLLKQAATRGRGGMPRVRSDDGEGDRRRQRAEARTAHRAARGVPLLPRGQRGRTREEAPGVNPGLLLTEGCLSLKPTQMCVVPEGKNEAGVQANCSSWRQRAWPGPSPATAVRSHRRSPWRSRAGWRALPSRSRADRRRTARRR